MSEARDGDRREGQVSADPGTNQENPLEEQRNEARAAETEPESTPRIHLDNQRPSTSQQNSSAARGHAASSFIENRQQYRQTRDRLTSGRYWDNDDILSFEDEMRFPSEWHEIHKRSMIRLKELCDKMLDKEEGEVDR